MDRTSPDPHNAKFYTILFKNGDIGQNYIYEYIELESKRRKYLPEFGKPMDIIQFLVDNSNYVEEDVVKMGFQLQRVIESGIMIMANRLYSLIVELSLRPDVCKELLNEQLSLIEMNNGSTHIPFEMLDNMVLLDAFIKECFRMSGAKVFMLRISTQDVVMSNGVTIPKGGYIGFNIQAHNRNPKLFGPNANSFDYKRHIRLGMKLSDASLANLIWGAGGRICLARLYSVAIIKLVMAILIRNFEFYPNYRPQGDCNSEDFDTSHYTIFSDRNKTSGLYAVQRSWKHS
ncbi:Cytochrome [Zancudomyces culisetae]|uniref:Cytochrome n=1 Tax=Zancudomyces culisetae TaxID=1213189 RepID=A0A1R1PTE3_ZANCU|nr:Cytochrome [Zancudomyces culisetae]|eukprot:OMH84173.1 Cytochrome [Zancudomyces culisetae]